MNVKLLISCSFIINNLFQTITEVTMILSCQNISKSFNEKAIIKDCSFHIEENQKVALVGINGSGKTTLIRMITGEMLPDEGQIVFSKDSSFGYLAQNASVESANTIYEELLSVKKELIDIEQKIRHIELQMKNANQTALDAFMKQYTLLTHQFEIGGGYIYQSLIIGVLKGLGFTEEEFSKNVGTLSGGQKTRIALGKLLLASPDLIILDEPTNHLDMSSIAWLENYLLNYKGAVLVVSHDRYFLNKIASRIIDLEHTKVTTFSGNYTEYVDKKEQLRQAEWKAYENQQKVIAHQEDVIEKLRSFNREKSIRRAESREKMLSKIKVIEKPLETENEIRFSLNPRKTSGNDVLSVKELTKSFSDTPLFSQISFDIKRGEHVAIIGDNGTGKTTILKMINQLIDPDFGMVSLGANVQIGYYDQEHHILHGDKNLFEEISDDYPTLSNTEIRNVLAAFLFLGDDVFKKIKTLSGGERGRVSLAKLMLSEANFLILDEPTNHLDIESKEILEDALNHYTGTILYVSHDRYFMNRTADRILELTPNGLIQYLGNYDYYLEKKETLSLSQTSAEQDPLSTSDSLSESKSDWQTKKEMQAAERKRENELKKTESKIDTLEQRTAQIDLEMSSPEVCINVAKLQALTAEREALALELTTLYEYWESLQTE